MIRNIMAVKQFLIVEFSYSINKYWIYQHEIRIDGSSIRKAL